MIFVNSYTSFPNVAATPVSVEYPPADAPMTANTTTISGKAYGNGTYIATRSIAFGASYDVYRMFDKVTLAGNMEWITGVNYTAGTGVYNGSTTTVIVGIVNPVGGEWCQIQLPNAIVLTSYAVQSVVLNRGPRTWKFLGSNNNSTWILLDERSSQTFSAVGSTNPYNITGNSTAYLYYRVVIEAANPATDGYLQFGNLALFGYNI